MLNLDGNLGRREGAYGKPGEQQLPVAGPLAWHRTRQQVPRTHVLRVRHVIIVAYRRGARVVRILSSSRSATGWRAVPGSAPPLRLVTDPQWLCSRVELASKTRREAAERSVPDLVFELASSGGQVGQRGTFQAGSGFHEGLEVPGEFTGLLRAEDLLQDFLEGRH
jgi:hypothetical protein